MERGHSGLILRCAREVFQKGRVCKVEPPLLKVPDETSLGEVGNDCGGHDSPCTLRRLGRDWKRNAKRRSRSGRRAAE